MTQLIIALLLCSVHSYAVTYSEMAAFVKEKEALRLKPYRCPAGKLTIGWGHVITKKDAWMKKGITREQAQLIFRQDLQCAYDATVKLGIKNRDTALVLMSAVINCGTNIVKSFLKNPKSFSRYVHANGKVLKGLVIRRKGESDKLASIKPGSSAPAVVTATPPLTKATPIAASVSNKNNWIFKCIDKLFKRMGV